MIMKLKLPGPSITRTPSKDLGGAPTISSKCPEILQIIHDRDVIQVFPNLTTVLKIFMTLTIMRR